MGDTICSCTDHCWKGAKWPDKQHYLQLHRPLLEGSVADWLQHKLNNAELVEGSRRARGPDENLICMYNYSFGWLSTGSAASVMMTWKIARSLYYFFLHLLLCLFRYLLPVEVLIFYFLKSLYYVRPHSSTLQWRLRWVQLNLGPANSYLFVCSLHWLTIMTKHINYISYYCHKVGGC